jgi:hypothetical protein
MMHEIERQQSNNPSSIGERSKGAGNDGIDVLRVEIGESECSAYCPSGQLEEGPDPRQPHRPKKKGRQEGGPSEMLD